MGCRACVQDPTRQRLFGSDRLCPECHRRFQQIRPPRLRVITKARMLISLLAAGCATLLMLAVVLYNEADQAEWDECARKVSGPVSKVIDACGKRPV